MYVILALNKLEFKNIIITLKIYKYYYHCISIDIALKVFKISTHFRIFAIYCIELTRDFFVGSLHFYFYIKMES